MEPCWRFLTRLSLWLRPMGSTPRRPTRHGGSTRPTASMRTSDGLDHTSAGWGTLNARGTAGRTGATVILGISRLTFLETMVEALRSASSPRRVRDRDVRVPAGLSGSPDPPMCSPRRWSARTSTTARFTLVPQSRRCSARSRPWHSLGGLSLMRRRANTPPHD